MARLSVRRKIKDIVQYTFSNKERFSLELIWWYYAFKLKRSLKLIMEGQR